MGNKNTNKQNVVPTPTLLPNGKQLPTSFQIPASPTSANPINGLTPTLIPLHFTGGNLTQDLPTDVKLFSQQKTDLRRKAPLTLPFGTISFDYTNDKFILTLVEPKDQSQTSFNTWLQQTYPALTEDAFIFN